MILQTRQGIAPFSFFYATLSERLKKTLDTETITGILLSMSAGVIWDVGCFSGLPPRSICEGEGLSKIPIRSGAFGLHPGPNRTYPELSGPKKCQTRAAGTRILPTVYKPLTNRLQTAYKPVHKPFTNPIQTYTR